MFGLFKKKKPEPVEVTPDHATFYIADPSLLGSKVLDTVTGILSYEGTNDETGNATGLRLRLKAGEVVMNFMPAHMIEEHLAGMSGYAEHEVRDKERLPYVLHRISQVRFVVGCVIPQGFDDEGTMIETLLHLNGALNGLFFLGDSLFDHDAQPIAGSACDE
ncbi:MAG TPA: hypothetical protein VJS65_03075 [Verrucomicrobiae bacterium]|nr:hypothetical protein [Verrucomicrobiae bacterium]